MNNTWTTKQRYLPYDAFDDTYKQQLSQRVNQSIWRMHYHIQPPTGLLNDPNGFSFYDGQWHLFYQIYPMGPVHGNKSWYHLTSTNLIDWQPLGIAMQPDTMYDSHGVYSGSALPVDDQLFLMYTGNVRTKDWDRCTYQLGALYDGHTTAKCPTPLIAHQPKGYTSHFRDPQIIQYNNQYIVFIGAQDTDEQGRIAVYTIKDKQTFHYEGQLTFTDQPMGYMIECPNIVFIDHTPVLIFCPQGLDTHICDYQNIYPNMYITASSLDTNTFTLTQPSALHLLDYGFDCYATQAFNAPDGRALAVSWIGLPDIEYPSDVDGWAHCLSLVKTLTLHHGHLYQYPVEETKQLRQQKAHYHIVPQSQAQCVYKQTHNTYELAFTVPSGQCVIIDLMANETHTSYLRLTIDTVQHIATLDRSHTGIPYAKDYGMTRTAPLPEGPINVTAFVDVSTVELFFNEGYSVMTSRSFVRHTDEQCLFVTTSQTPLDLTYYSLRHSSLNKG